MGESQKEALVREDGEVFLPSCLYLNYDVSMEQDTQR